MGEGKGVSGTDRNELAVQHRLVGAAWQGDFNGGRQSGGRGGQLDATEVDEALDRRRPLIGSGDMMVGGALRTGMVV